MKIIAKTSNEDEVMRLNRLTTALLEKVLIIGSTSPVIIKIRAARNSGRNSANASVPPSVLARQIKGERNKNTRRVRE